MIGWRFREILFLLLVLNSFPVTPQLFALEQPPTVAFTSTEFFANELSQTAVLSVARTGIGRFSVDYIINATNGIAAASGTLQFAESENIKYITVPITDDTLPIGDAIANAQLLNPTSSAVLSEPSTASLHVIENDLAGGVDPVLNSVLKVGPTSLIKQGNDAFIVKPGISHNNGLVQLVRIAADGTTDPSFQTPALSYTDRILADSQGRILFVAQDQLSAIFQPAILGRLRSEGTLDPDFQTNVLSRAPVLSALLMESDSVLLGRYVDSASTASGDVCLQRFDSQGKPISFGSNLKIRFMVSDPFLGWGGITALAHGAGGTLLIAGTFSSINGIPAPGLARLDGDGNFDSTFAPALLAPPQADPRFIYVQPDGKIMLAGAFRLPGSQTVSHVVRLTASGQVDPTFTTVVVSQTALVDLMDSAVWEISPETSGRLFIRGPFNRVNGDTHLAIARINSDGTIDSSFNAAQYMPGRNLFTQITAMLLDEPRGIVVGGSFSHIDFAPRTNLTRLFLRPRPDGPRLSQTISFDPIQDQVYGSPPIPLSAKSSSGLPIQLRVVSGNAFLSQSQVIPTTAGPIVLEASQSGNDDYSPASPVLVIFNVAKATQTIQFEPVPVMTYLDPPYDLKATASSGLTVSFEVLSGPAWLLAGPNRFSINRLSIFGAGAVTIRASQPGDSRYEPASTEQSFTIKKAAQAITFDPPDEVRLDWQWLFLDSHTTAGQPITYEILTGPAHLNGPTLLLDAEGLVTLRATQPGNENVEPALPVEWIIKISSAPSLILELRGSLFTLTWPKIYDSFILEESSLLDGPWLPSPIVPVILSDYVKAELEHSQSARFFRLRSSTSTNDTFSKINFR